MEFLARKQDDLKYVEFLISHWFSRLTLSSFMSEDIRPLSQAVRA